MARRRHNTQTPRDRQKLVEDFERRVEYDRREGDLRHLMERPRSLAWVVHPTADETELLAEIGARPENCRWADAYWRYRDSVYFLQLNGCPSPDDPPSLYDRPPGLYYRFDKSYRQDIFDVFLPRPVVTSTDFHSVFDLLEALIDSGRIDRERAALQDTEGRWIGTRERLAEVT